MKNEWLLHERRPLLHTIAKAILEWRDQMCVSFSFF